MQNGIVKCKCILKESSSYRSGKFYLNKEEINIKHCLLYETNTLLKSKKRIYIYMCMYVLYLFTFFIQQDYQLITNDTNITQIQNYFIENV